MSAITALHARSVRRVFLALYTWSEAGGIEQVVTSLAGALKRQGIDVFVFAWRCVADAEGQYLAKLRQSRIGFISSNGFLGRLAWDWNYRVETIDALVSRINPWLSPLHWLRARHKRCSRDAARQSLHNRLRHWLIRLTATYDLDRYMRWRMTLVSLIRPPSVINQQGYGSAAALRWGKHRNVPTVYSEQNTPDETSFSIYWSRIANDIANADCITAVSSGSAERLGLFLGVDKNTITVIPQPIEFRAPPDAGLRKALRSDLPRARRLLAVGRLHAMKGFDILIEAAAVLAARGQTFEVVLAGDGPQRADLLALIQVRRLADRVRYLGHLEHDALPSVFAECGVMVCPSRNLEGLPLAAIEAMSFGLPLVASDIVAFKDVVAHDDNGLVFPVGNVTALADALEYLLNNPGRRQAMGARGQSRFDQGGFQSDRIAQRYLDVYQGALGKGSQDRGWFRTRK